jgi:hypothetical protein
MAQLQSFAQWLAGHAGLVKSLSMKPCWKHRGNAVIGGLRFEAHLAAAQELLQLSIHAAGAPLAAGNSTRPSLPSTAAAAAAAAATEATTAAAAAAVTEDTALESIQQQQGLRLHSFSSSLPKAVDMLAALQVQHLTRVDLSLFRDAVTDSSALS